MATKSSRTGWPGVFRFIASLMFLYVVSQQSASVASQIWWVPLMLSVAILSTFSLFLITVANMVWKVEKYETSGTKAMMYAAFALLALAFAAPASGLSVSQILTSSLNIVLVVVGYVIGWLGNTLED